MASNTNYITIEKPKGRLSDRIYVKSNVVKFDKNLKKGDVALCGIFNYDSTILMPNITKITVYKSVYLSVYL